MFGGSKNDTCWTVGEMLDKCQICCCPEHIEALKKFGIQKFMQTDIVAVMTQIKKELTMIDDE